MGTKDGGKKPNPNDLNSFKGFFYYMIIIVVMTVLLNGLVFPSALKSQVKEVGYNEFLTMVDNGQVTQVEKDDTNGEIVFITKDSNGKQQIYKTGLWDDPDLTERLYSKGVTFDKVIPQKESAIMAFFTNWILPFVIMIGLGQILSRSMAKRMGGNAMTFGKSNAKIYAESETGVTFADVAGEEEAKDALKEIVDFLHDPKKYSDIGATLPKGALLVGPPGTGKTLLASAVAGETNSSFFNVTGSEFVEKYVGVGAKRVRTLFEKARKEAPSIIFIDEIDAIGAKRHLESNNEKDQTLNQLLVEMDGFTKDSNVIIIGATNRLDLLDEALLRPGRFDRHVHIGAPNYHTRYEILKVHTNNKPIAPSVNLETLAKKTHGFNGAHLANIANEAAIFAVRDNSDVITEVHFDKALERVIAGLESKNSTLIEKEKKIVSYHEAGHALVSDLVGICPIQKISIVPRGQALGYVLQLPDEDRYIYTKEELLGKMKILLAGKASEEIIFNHKSTGAKDDLKKVTEIANQMVCEYGMSNLGFMTLDGNNKTFLSEKIQDEANRIVQDCYNETLDILRNNINDLHIVSNHLFENETMTHEELKSLIRKEMC